MDTLAARTPHGSKFRACRNLSLGKVSTQLQVGPATRLTFFVSPSTKATTSEASDTGFFWRTKHEQAESDDLRGPSG